MTTDDSWSVATGEHNGIRVTFRIRNQPPAFARKESFPHLLTVGWEYESPDDQGMPSPTDAERMGHLEDLLAPAFEGACHAFLTVVATGNGVREWQWYARDPDAVMKLVNQTLREHERFPVQFSFQNDPAWEAYSRFLDIPASNA